MTYRRRRFCCRLLAHDPADLLAVDDKTLVAQLGADPPIAVSLELVADNDDFRDEFHVAYWGGRHIIAGTS